MKKIFRRIENRGIEAWKDGEVRRRIIDPSSTIPLFVEIVCSSSSVITMKRETLEDNSMFRINYFLSRDFFRASLFAIIDSKLEFNFSAIQSDT